MARLFLAILFTFVETAHVLANEEQGYVERNFRMNDAFKDPRYSSVTAAKSPGFRVTNPENKTLPDTTEGRLSGEYRGNVTSTSSRNQAGFESGVLKMWSVHPDKQGGIEYFQRSRNNSLGNFPQTRRIASEVSVFEESNGYCKISGYSTGSAGSGYTSYLENKGTDKESISTHHGARCAFEEYTFSDYGACKKLCYLWHQCAAVEFIQHYGDNYDCYMYTILDGEVECAIPQKLASENNLVGRHFTGDDSTSADTKNDGYIDSYEWDSGTMSYSAGDGYYRAGDGDYRNKIVYCNIKVSTEQQTSSSENATPVSMKFDISSIFTAGFVLWIFVGYY